MYDLLWQVALVLEAVLIHFFARTYQGQLQSALLPTKTATQALVTTMPASTAAAVKPSASSVASVSAPEAHHPEVSSSSSSTASASGSALSPHPFVNTSTSSPPAPAVARRAAVTVEPANSCFDIDWAVSCCYACSYKSF